jgi:hypothetical protein
MPPAKLRAKIVMERLRWVRQMILRIENQVKTQRAFGGRGG